MKNLIVLICSLAWAIQGHAQAPKVIVLPMGYPVSLELLTEINAATMVVGQAIDLQVRFPIKYNGETIIHQGAYAEGVVTEVHLPRSFGRPGSITIEAHTVQTSDHQLIHLQGQPLHFSGKSRQGKAIGVSVTAGFGSLALATPAGLTLALVGVFIKGKKVTLLQGTILQAKVMYETEIHVF